MTTLPDLPAPAAPDQPERPSVRSLQELINLVSGKEARPGPQEDAGLAEPLPFPFLALVGQQEMKLALLLAVINPAVGGVLLVGPRGTGKTTAVRSLAGLLPEVERSTCFYGCLPEDIEAGGMDAVCPDCARKYAEGQPLSHLGPVQLVELPLNARLEDVIGGLDERAAVHDRLRLKRGILAQADLNLLYIDEANLLADEIVNSILDASAQGSYTVRRGPVSATYRARFTLIGSMNPEEGRLRPQIMDRFGLRVLVNGLEDGGERMEAYRRVLAYRSSPRAFTCTYEPETGQARAEIIAARRLLPEVTLPDEVARVGIDLARDLGIDSLRAEITLFEAARALAAADGRTQVCISDLETVAVPALRMRRSAFLANFGRAQSEEEQELRGRLLEKTGERR